MIAIDGTSPVPPYEQIRSQLATQIGDGTLPAGTRLPTVRRLAGDLGLAVNTVARAYKELEAAGLVTARARAGTVVSAAGDQSRARLVDAARDYAHQARALGIDAHDALGLVAAALQIDPAGSTGRGR